MKKLKMKTPLGINETIIRNGGANLLHGMDNAGGKLILTNQRVIFEAHRFNISRGEQLIDLMDITKVEKAWTKFLGFIPLFPNAVLVTVSNGKRFRFALWGRKKWAKAILEAKVSVTTA